MAAGIAIYAGKTVVEIAACEKFLHRYVPMRLPEAVGFFETRAVTALEAFEMLHHQLIERACFRISLPVYPLGRFHGGEGKGKECTQMRIVWRFLS